MASPLAIVLSGGILLFAFLGGYRPNLRIRPIDVLVAAVGIGVVVLIIGAVVLAQGNH
jgi:multisubunit Na+/H+ antiporter MnhB subunit